VTNRPRNQSRAIGGRPISQNEWDFRGIPPNEVEFALRYEHIRSSDRIIDIVEWLESPLAGSLQTRRDELVNAFYLKKLGRFNHSVLLKGNPFHRSHEEFLGLPLPWKAIEPKFKSIINISTSSMQAFPVTDDWDLYRRTMNDCDPHVPFPGSKTDEFGKEKASQNGKGIYCFKINWIEGVERIAADFKALLKSIAPIAQLPRKKCPGWQPFGDHNFKRLAAWNLEKTGISWKISRNFIAGHLRLTVKQLDDLPKDDYKVLPIYKSAGAWRNGIDGAVDFHRQIVREFLI
jgi:hypothetical protein